MAWLVSYPLAGLGLYSTMSISVPYFPVLPTVEMVSLWSQKADHMPEEAFLSPVNSMEAS